MFLIFASHDVLSNHGAIFVLTTLHAAHVFIMKLLRPPAQLARPTFLDTLEGIALAREAWQTMTARPVHARFS